MIGPDANGWMPIETALKDGTEVLLWDGASIIGYWWHGRQFPGSPFTSFWSDGPVPCSGYDAGQSELHRVTHWQPLPGPPVSS